MPAPPAQLCPDGGVFRPGETTQQVAGVHPIPTGEPE
jgi:hypothetical protein